MAALSVPALSGCASTESAGRCGLAGGSSRKFVEQLKKEDDEAELKNWAPCEKRAKQHANRPRKKKSNGAERGQLA